jgi:hypothetical protein
VSGMEQTLVLGAHRWPPSSHEAPPGARTRPRARPQLPRQVRLTDSPVQAQGRRLLGHPDRPKATPRGRTGRSTGATAAARDDPWRSPHPGTPSWSGAAATTVFQRLHMPPLAGATAWLNSDPIEPPACAAALSWWTAVRLVILISLAGPVRSTCERDRASPASGGVIGRRSNVRRWSTAAYSESHDSPLFTWCSLIKWTI